MLNNKNPRCITNPIDRIGKHQRVSDYNRDKLEIPEALDELGEAAVADVAPCLDGSHGSVGMALLRYHHQGLVGRYRGQGRTSMHRLTDRGWERLEYLRSLYRRIIKANKF